jgi:GGDEF domain-containing protein
MGKKSILVFDICSSTLFVEDLKKRDMTDKYKQLIKDITDFLDENSSIYEFIIYKFLGDGFILIFPEEIEVDKILLFIINLTDRCERLLDIFIHKHIQTSEIPRVGITIGLDRGELIEIKLNKEQIEYIGRSINVACRLQQKLTGPFEVNRCLMTNDMYNEITLEDLKRVCHPVRKKLKNINNDIAINCYDFYPLFYKNADLSVLRESKRDIIKEYISNKKLKISQIKKLYEIAINPSSAATIDEFINTQRLK